MNGFLRAEFFAIFVDASYVKVNHSEMRALDLWRESAAGDEGGAAAAK